MGCGVGKHSDKEGYTDIVKAKSERKKRRKHRRVRGLTEKGDEEGRGKRTGSRRKRLKPKGAKEAGSPTSSSSNLDQSLATVQPSLCVTRSTVDTGLEQNDLRSNYSVSFLNALRNPSAEKATEPEDDDSRRNTLFSGWGVANEASGISSDSSFRSYLRALYVPGQSVRVRNDETDTWRQGIVQNKSTRPVVLVDGKTATWKFILPKQCA